MWKTILAGATAIAVVGASLVYAQAQSGTEGPRPSQQQQRTAQDASAYIEARLAALRAGLVLTPEQEKNWPAFEQAYREFAKTRLDLREERFGQARLDNPIERMQRNADALTRRGAALKRLADAAGPLYQSLDDAQKRRAERLGGPMLRFGAAESWRGRHGWRDHGVMGPRFGWNDRDDHDRYGWRHRHRMGPGDGDWRGPRDMPRGPDGGAGERL
jgi:hypothetical protein